MCVCACVCGREGRRCPFLSQSEDPPPLNLLPTSPALVAMLSSYSPFSRPCLISALCWERKNRVRKLRATKNLPGAPSVLSPFALVSALVYADWVCL